MLCYWEPFNNQKYHYGSEQEKSQYEEEPLSIMPEAAAVKLFVTVHGLHSFIYNKRFNEEDNQDLNDLILNKEKS